MDLAKLRVLVVDDMSSLRMMVKAVLVELGVGLIKEASDGAKAIEMLDRPDYDLIICDWDMPKATGLDVLQHVRGHAAIAGLPFIMLTANSNRGHVNQALEAGVSDYLAKPFKPQDLEKKIQRALRPKPSNPAA